ncbi:alpha/beta hydrolase [Fulvivirga maritima]|uniref:alpha/beta fold hydrolase n=1 Tax=Fulvivirga maritima TaxID=2904247 RepID=UPI001F194965|nr:alpha/beta hydrolase [Fulvivirga maritima]UII29289.1 alpha/beta hydrolase [Fulvivirga maritima]
MKKKKKIKTPLPIRAVGWLFPKVEKIAPILAKRWFAHVFFTPVRYKVPYGEQDARAEAKKGSLQYNGSTIQYYTWGEGKPVLFCHGWMGRGTQFRKFIPVFNMEGYQVISFDATGHGLSEGKRSHLMEFADIITLMNSEFGPFEMVVGHSLGGVSALHAIHSGVDTQKLVMISSPTLGDKIIEAFLKKLKASEACKVYLETFVQKKFGQPFEVYEAVYVAKKLRPIDVLLIYDKDDDEVDMDNPKAFMDVYPSARLVTTQELGHTRILKDDKVIEATLEHLQGEVMLRTHKEHSVE